MVANGIEQDLRAGQELIGEGERADVVYLVVDGCLLASGGPAGLPFHVLPGELAGAVPGGEPSGALRAQTDSTVLEIASGRVEARLAQDPAFAARLAEIAPAFTPECLREHKARLAAERQLALPEEPLSRDAVRDLHVHELIERMLRYDAC